MTKLRATLTPQAAPQKLSDVSAAFTQMFLGNRASLPAFTGDTSEVEATCPSMVTPKGTVYFQSSPANSMAPPTILLAPGVGDSAWRIPAKVMGDFNPANSIIANAALVTGKDGKPDYDLRLSKGSVKDLFYLQNLKPGSQNIDLKHPNASNSQWGIAGLVPA